MTTLASGKCPHCGSGGDAVAVHETEFNLLLTEAPQESYCCACGKWFENPAPAVTRDSEPLTLEQQREEG